jgi:hypothetical protein
MKSHGTHVFIRGFLPSRTRRRDNYHDATCLKEWSKSVGKQGLQRGRIGSEATTFSQHVQIDALELTHESATAHDP